MALAGEKADAQDRIELRQLNCRPERPASAQITLVPSPCTNTADCRLAARY